MLDPTGRMRTRDGWLVMHARPAARGRPVHGMTVIGPPVGAPPACGRKVCHMAKILPVPRVIRGRFVKPASAGFSAGQPTVEERPQLARLLMRQRVPGVIDHGKGGPRILLEQLHR